MKTKARQFLSICVLIYAAAASYAQNSVSGGLGGTVVDPSQAVVSDADVEIRDQAKGTTQSTRTDHEGSYRFFFLVPGRYTLTVTHTGFHEEKRLVDVLVGPPVSVNVILNIEKTNTSVTVTDEAPLLQAENGDVAATMNQTQVSEVPNPGNDLTYIVQTAPGVTMNTDSPYGGSFTMLGMPGSSYRYTTDGASDTYNGNNGVMTNGFGLLSGQNQIQEATVVSNGYSGQFGGAAGGNINYVSKSGSNQFHGNAQYYWNGSVLNANDWFGNTFGIPRPFDNANQWAASLGGPIKKNRVFFFLDNEGMRLFIAVPLLIVAPTPELETATMQNIDSKFGAQSASHDFYQKIFHLFDTAPGANTAQKGNPGDPLGGCGPTFDVLRGSPCTQFYFLSPGRPSHNTLTAGRVDWNISRNDRAFFRLRYEDGAGAAYNDPINSAFDADWNVQWWQGQVIENHAFGSSAASQFLFARSYYSSLAGVKDASLAHTTFPTTLYSGPGFFVNGLGGIGAFDLPIVNGVPEYQISEDVVKTHAHHHVGFGASFEGIHWTLSGYQLNSVGSLFVQTMDAFYQGGFDPASKDVDFTLLSQSFESGRTQYLGFYNLAFYAQDEWHARPNLSFTFALRAEHQSNPSCERRCFVRLAGPFASVSHDPAQPYNQAIFINQKPALSATDAINWSPRISFAWQPFGASHSTVLRGGAGIFFDPLQGNLAQTLSSNPPLLNSYTISGYNLAPGETDNLGEKDNLFDAATKSNAEFIDGFASGKTVADFKKVDPNFALPAITVPGSRTRTPQYQKWSLELQHAFGTATSINLGYFGHHGIHLLVLDPDVNAFGFGSLPAGLCASPPVPPCADARFSGVSELRSEAVSNYNGMVVSFRHRFRRWGDGLFQANYTYGHALDEVSNGGLYSFTGGSFLSPQDPNNIRGAYGPAEYDVRHSLNANYVWQVPLKSAFGGRGPDFLLKGWQVSGTVFARTGFPYTVFDGQESGQLASNNYFGQIYAVPVASSIPDLPCSKGAAAPLAPHPCQIAQFLPNGDPNPQARFVQPGCETGFNIANLPDPNDPTKPCGGPSVSFVPGRNRFRGLGYFNSDFTVMKSTKIPGHENMEFGIGLQMFNVFNYPNFGMPDHSTSVSTFGMLAYTNSPPTSLLGSGLGGDNVGRMIQIKAQLQF
jgi:hypothetical protein